MKRYIFVVLLISGIIISACDHTGLKGEQEPGMKEDGSGRICIRDADCEKDHSCWYKIPRGPLPGIPGSEENPGTCWSNDIINRTE